MSWETPPEGSIDIGNDHWLRYTRWAPDRDLNPQYKDIPDIPKYGATIWHRERGGDGGYHAGGVTFDIPEVRNLDAIEGYRQHETWQVELWEPLTISPSVLCQCGDHGFVRAGKWVSA